MPLEVRLPELGGSVTHAKLSVWLKREGDRVSAGEPIAEVETDKTSVEIEAPGDGVLAKIHVSEGADQVPIHALLALIAVDGAVCDTEASAKGGEGAPSAVPPVAVTSVDVSRADVARQVVVERFVDAANRSATVRTDGPDADIPASPFVRRMAYAAGISLARITGTGPGGRITKQDVDGVLGRRSRVQPAPEVTPATAAASDEPAAYDVQPPSRLRRVTAERLAQAKQTIPHFYLRIDCAMDRVAQIRHELNARGEAKLSFTAFMVRAAALALRKVPAANALWVDGEVRIYRTADIAVAVNTPSGLIAPVIRRADEKSLLTIAREMRDLSERARTGQLEPADYSGGTFTISNLGMYGVSSLYPIINPPQTCILGLGAIEQRPIVRDQAITIRTMMTCTLSADHRALDGAMGSEFLAAYRRLIEDPWGLIL